MARERLAILAHCTAKCGGDMNEERIRNTNEDKPWSEMDLFVLQNNTARGDLVEETAEFLMRREEEVRRKVKELCLKKARLSAQAN